MDTSKVLDNKYLQWKQYKPTLPPMSKTELIVLKYQKSVLQEALSHED